MGAGADRRPRAPRMGERVGWLVLVGSMAALVAPAIWSVLHPRQGLPLLALALCACVLLLRQLVRRERRDGADQLERLCGIATPQGDAWRALFDAEGLAAHSTAVAPLLRRAIRLSPRRTQAPGRSHLGGRPTLPVGHEWPRCAGRPLDFLLQLDLAEIRALGEGPLPADGLLCFFFSAEVLGQARLRGAACPVVYAPADAGIPTEPPADAQPPAVLQVPCALELVAYDDLPDLDARNPLRARLDEEEAGRYRDIAAFLAGGGGDAHHKLLGHAEPFGDSMELACEILAAGGSSSTGGTALTSELLERCHRWRLLLQLDSDESVPWLWGDLGRLYFWIPEEDLRQARFDRVTVLSDDRSRCA